MRETAPAPPMARPPTTRASARALAVLEALASAGQPYTLSQLAARLHIQKRRCCARSNRSKRAGYVIHMPRLARP